MRIEEFLRLLKGVKKSGAGWVAICPSHEDSSPSLSVAHRDERILLNCFANAGCDPESICTALHISVQDLFDDEPIKSGKATIGGVSEPASSEPCTLEALSKYMAIHPERMKSWGLEDGRFGGSPAVLVPYRDHEGGHLRDKYRTKVSGKDKYAWGQGSAGMHPYGMDRAAASIKEKGSVIITEGESDCWSLWDAAIQAAICLPGAQSSSILPVETLKALGVSSAWIGQDADESGSRFVDDVASRLKDAGIEPYVLRCPPGVKDLREWRQRDAKKFRDQVTKAILAREKVVCGVPDIEIVRVADLLKEKLTPIRWIVEEILPPGFTLLAAPAKTGKSFVCGNIAYSFSLGGVALGGFQTFGGGGDKVIYFDIEKQNRWKAQKRWNTVLAGGQCPSTLLTSYKLNQMDDGGMDQLRRMLDRNPAIRLVIIDVLTKFWPSNPSKFGGSKGNIYQQEYAILTPLVDLANERGIAILGVWHTNKMADPDDPFDSVSGSKAMTGAPNTVWTMRRLRGSKKAQIWVTGDDIEDEREYNFTWSPIVGTWAVDDFARRRMQVKSAGGDMRPFTGDVAV